MKLEVSFITYFINNFCSDGSNYVRSSMFECSKPKIGVRVRLPKDEHVQCPFDVRSIVGRTFKEHQTTIKNAIFHEISIIGGFQLLTKELFPNILSGKSY